MNQRGLASRQGFSDKFSPARRGLSPGGPISKGKKTGGHDFPPGVSGNPKGRPPTPEDVKIVRRATLAEFDNTLATIAEMPADALERLSKDKATPGLTRALAKCLYLAGRSGDPRRLGVILDRMHGRAGAQRADDVAKRGSTADLTDEELDTQIAALDKAKRGGRV